MMSREITDSLQKVIKISPGSSWGFFDDFAGNLDQFGTDGLKMNQNLPDRHLRYRIK